jgi:hypothetical protein
MSDISVTARDAAQEPEKNRLETVVALDDELWLRQVVMSAAIGIGVAISAAIAVALFLR